jgi:hypothetical protein
VSDRLIGLLLLGACALFYWQSTLIRQPAFAAFEALGAESFPRAVIVALALLSVVLAVRGRGPLARPLAVADVRAWLDRYRLPLVSLALFVSYAFAIGPFGWYIASALYLVAMQLVLLPRLGRQLVYVLAGSLLFTVALGQVFERFLHLVLPRAQLF